MHYFPYEGRVDKMYFPYYGKKAHVSIRQRSDDVVFCAVVLIDFCLDPRPQENYVQPLVAVKLMLTKEDYNKELSVECRVEGSNLRNNDERDKFLGRVTFRIKVVE